MSDNERSEYSLTRAIRNAADGKLGGIELEASKEVENRFGRPAQGFYVPNDVLTRDLTATAGDTGDKLVATLKPSMIEALKAQPIVAQLGARVLSGLSSNITLPKAGTNTAYWTDENDSGSALSESTMTIGSISLSPKRVAAYSELSKQLLAQSSFDVESMVRGDLLYQLNLAFDKVAIDGGGTNEPSGVLDASGLHGQTGGQTWQNMVDAEADVLSTHALAGSLAYVATPANMAVMKAADKGTDTGQFIWASNSINGYPAFATTQMTSGTTVFGDFSQVILAEFGSGVDVVVDPYSLALTGLIRVHVARLVDVGIRHGAAFCKITA
jgi:HK97 family phage major capsid protein